MKKPGLALLATITCFSIFAQQTKIHNDPQEKFREAKEYFQKEQYSLAYPILKELQQSVRETDKANNAIVVQEIEYYTVVCALKQSKGANDELSPGRILFPGRKVQ
jgi:hypothetical protein